MPQHSLPENPNAKLMFLQSATPATPLPNVNLTFSGSGLNDLVVGGSYNKQTMATFVITISNTGSPNKIDWIETGGSGSSASNVNISGSAQTLADGVTVTIPATTGHTLNNAWTVIIKPSSQMFWDSSGQLSAIWSNGVTAVMSGSGGATNWASPGTIGSTTPNTGAFTTLTSAAHTITGTSDAVQETIKGFSTQTNPLIQLKNSSNAVIGSWSGDGTTLTFGAAAGSGGQIYSPNGNVYIRDSAGNNTNIYGQRFYATSDHLRVGADDIELYASGKLFWGNASTIGGTPDIGMSRNAAGILEINTGTAGVFAALKVSTLTAGTSLIVNGGTSVTKILSTTAALNFTDTAAGDATDLTVTLTGAALGDAVILGIPNASMPSDGAYNAWVSATDTVTVRFINNNLLTSINPTIGTFRVTVMQF